MGYFVTTVSKRDWIHVHDVRACKYDGYGESVPVRKLAVKVKKATYVTNHNGKRDWIHVHEMFLCVIFDDYNQCIGCLLMV